MLARMSQPTERRLKRSSFIHQSRILEKRDPELLDHKPRAIPPNISVPSWKKAKSTVIKDNVPGIESKGTQTDSESKSLTSKYFQSNYHQHTWTHACTDGTATAATRDGGGGVYIRCKGEESSISFPTGTFSTNFKVETRP